MRQPHGNSDGTIPWVSLFSMLMAGFTIQVIGVVKDYHNQSLHHGIVPLILENSPSLHWVAVRLAPGDLRTQLATLESVWKQFLPGRPFEYQFFDEVLDTYYQSEITLQKVCGIFAALSIFISLFGNARIDRVCHTTAHQRDRHTQSTRCFRGQNHSIANPQFPMANYHSQRNRMAGGVLSHVLPGSMISPTASNLEPLMFIATGLLTLGIVLITVGGQAWRAANANPVDALRDE